MQNILESTYYRYCNSIKSCTWKKRKLSPVALRKHLERSGSPLQLSEASPRRFWSRPVRKREWPSRASCTATALPNPLDAPVTNTRRGFILLYLNLAEFSHCHTHNSTANSAYNILRKQSEDHHSPDTKLMTSPHFTKSSNCQNSRNLVGGASDVGSFHPWNQIHKCRMQVIQPCIFPTLEVVPHDLLHLGDDFQRLKTYLALNFLISSVLNFRVLLQLL